MKELVEKINTLKKDKNAVILAHNYQVPHIQDIADYVGDSLDLSRKASYTDADIIVFCGVLFMAETAKILSPKKKVLIPDRNAGCPLADMINVDMLDKLKTQHPKAAVVTYVNSSAHIKAHSDICCTSANAAHVVNSISNDEIIFIPDKNLGQYIKSKTNKKLVLCNGFCPVHNQVTKQDLTQAKALHSNAIVIVHPECLPEITSIADEVLSTGGMLKFAKSSSSKDFIVGTEEGILYRLKKENPDKNFYAMSQNMICSDMKLINLENLYNCLKNDQVEVVINEHIRKRAYGAVSKMINLT